jgi:hypothetical protein
MGLLFILMKSGQTEAEMRVVGNIPIVESMHPYANNTDETWLIFNDTGDNAASIHFSLIEIEDYVDRIELLDQNDAMVQRIDTSQSDLMSAPVPGPVIKIRLLSDTSDTAWGFAVDYIEGADNPAFAYSPHPYENNLNEVQWVFNDEENAPATRVIFSHLALEENVDYVILSGKDGTPHQWITGAYPAGLTSNAIPGAAVQVQLVTDSSVTDWGYNVSGVATASTPDPPESQPNFGEVLAESPHPHPTYCSAPDHLYTIVNPDPAAINSKIHFERVGMGPGDHLRIFDVDDRLIQKITGSRLNFWTDYVPGRVVKILMTCSDFYTGWGFLADAIATAGPKEVLAQSHHAYGGAEEWTMINDDPDAYSSKIHFEKLKLNSGDSIQIFDEEGTMIQYFGQYTNLTDTWSDYVPGRFIRVKLNTSDIYIEWGMRINDIVASHEGPVEAQSSHPYSNTDYDPWIIYNPNLQATETSIHFSRLSLSSGDSLQIMDENDNVIQSFGAYTDERDLWSEPVPGRVVKITLNTSDIYNAWGFRVDDISPESTEPIPSAFINNVYVNLLYPGTIYLDGIVVAIAAKPGEYKVPLSGTGDHIIHIDYPQHTQDILVSFGFGQQLSVVYLPLVEK